MESQAKIKIPTKQRPNVNDTPNLGGGENLRQSMVTGATSSNTGNLTLNNAFSAIIEDSVKLYGKDDIFNYELSPHQIETELLCSERLSF
jgi:SUMO ligase MMS21 Smc5/6 complex component